MPTRKKKSRKQRGSRTCGWGRVGQHRGSGMRGGKGRAGGRKHHLFRTMKYEPDRYEHKGFKPPSALEPEPETINVGELQHIAFKRYGIKGISEGADIDLSEMGYDKLLGRGEIDIPLTIKVSSLSKSAQEKIESAGGTIKTET
ncbi:MAG: uL15 family ribosomal protein [Candidatus Bathyarchaeia archaeon]